MDATNVEKAFEKILEERYKILREQKLEGSAESSAGPASGTKISIAPPASGESKKITGNCC